MKKSVRRLMKRILLGMLAAVLVITYSLFGGTDRMLRATELPDDTEVYAEMPEEQAADQETVELEIPAEDVTETSEQPVEETPEEITVDEPEETPSETETPEETPSETDTPEETPTEPETPAETPTEPETPEETPTEPETPAETPTEPETPAVTPAEPETPAVTPTEPETPAETPSEPETPTETPAEPEIPAVTPSEPETPAETPTEPETPAETPTEPAEEKPALTVTELYTTASDGAYVYVQAEGGAFPEGTYVNAVVVSSAHAQSTVENMIEPGRELVDLVVYDITIHDATGAEIEPSFPVFVSIGLSGVNAGEETSVYHIEESGEAQKMGQSQNGDAVGFTTDHFSQYAVASTASTPESSTYTMTTGESFTIPVPAAYTGKTCKWSSSNSNTASVSTSGTVTARRAGTAEITLQVLNRSGWFSSYETVGTYTIIITDPVQEPAISVTPGSVSLGEIGATAQLRASLTAISAENTIIWTSSDTSVVTVENGIVTARGQGTAVITASVSPEEDELYGNVYSDQAQVTVTFTGYNLYHYALIPGADANIQTSDANTRWFGLGVTKIYGTKSPSSLGKGKSVSEYVTGETVKALYPDITYAGQTYKYAPEGSAESGMQGYYTVQPFRTIVASGANSGYNNYNPTASALSFHLDYTCVLNEKDFVSANFAVMNAGGSAYESLTDYSQRFLSGTARSSIKKPSSSAVPSSKTVNGITYAFDGWYEDAACTAAASFTGELNANTTFYGRYVPVNARYRVEYIYDGIPDAAMTDVLGPVEIGTVITSYTDKPRTGFTFSEKTPASLTVSANEADNVIRVYYTKRLVSYTVGYYLNGTDIPVAPSRTASVRYFETGSGDLLEIEGYTPVDPSVSRKEMEISSPGMEIRFDYYKNVTVQADELHVPYNGAQQTVSGFTCSVPDAEFENISASRSEKNAGTYPVEFAEGTVGKTDLSRRYIITAAEAGVLEITRIPAEIAAMNMAKNYGDEDPQLRVSFSGLLSGDSLEYELQRDPGEDAGEYTIHVNAEAVQENYDVTVKEAVFTIAKSGEMALQADGWEGTYDGTLHRVRAAATVKDGTVIEYSTDGGSTWSRTAPSRRDAGEDTVRVRALNDNYETVYADAVLKVLPAEVTVRAKNAQKTYGSADPVFEAEVQGLFGSDTVAYELVRDEGEDAGTYPVRVQAEEEQGNYHVTMTDGELTIVPAVLSLNAITVQRMYSGQPLSGGVSAEMPAGTKLTYTADGETWTEEAPQLLHAGSLTYTVRAENPNYETAVASGTLSVTPRRIILTSASQTKEYDGQPLVNKDIYVSGDGFAGSEGMDFTVTGTQTAAGASRNTFTYAFHEDTNAADYTVETVFGTLNVTDRETKYAITVKAADHTLVYSGAPQKAEGLEQTVFTINGASYRVAGMSAALTKTNAGTYRIPVQGTAVVTDAEGNDVSAQFAVEREDGVLTVAARHIVLRSADAGKMYDGGPLTTAAWENSGVSVAEGSFAEGEGVIIRSAGSQTLPGRSPNTFTWIAAEGTLAGNYDIETQFGTLQVLSRSDAEKYTVTVQASSAEAVYTGSPVSVSGIVSDTFAYNGYTYRIEGLSSHAEMTDAGRMINEVTGEAVIRDSEGNDVTGQFRIEKEPGTLVIRPRQVILTSGSVRMQYDGSEARNSDILVGGEGFAEGEGADYSVTGVQSGIGSSDNIFTYVLQENTRASNYAIGCVYGRLEIIDRENKYEITVRSAGKEILYDGQTHTVSGISASSFTIEGNTYTLSGLSAAATGRNAGVYPNTITGTPTVTDAKGNDVTSQFRINTYSGELKITKRSVILTSASAEKEYDGLPLSDSTVTVSGDGWAKDEGAVYTVSGSRTITGSSANTFAWSLNENTDKDNYSISAFEGTLTVTSRSALYEITVQAAGGNYVYNGKVQRVSGLIQDTFTISSKTFTVHGLQASASAADAGTYTSTVQGTPAVLDEEGNDVSDQFSVHTVPGTMVIEPRRVTLTSMNASKVYDGSPLHTGNYPDSGVSVTNGSFVQNEGVSVRLTAERTLPGTVRNTFEYTLNPGTDPDNYLITAEYGSLTVMNRSHDALYPAVVSAVSTDVLYDGQPHGVHTLKGLTAGADGHVYYIKGLEVNEEQIRAGVYTARITGEASVFDSEGNDVTEQFSVARENGTLTIRRRSVVMTSSTVSREYDGTPLTEDHIRISGDGFAANEGADYVVTGSQTVVGSSPNTFSYTLHPGTYANDYDITRQTGMLTVGRREKGWPVVLQAASGEYMYDGSEHTVSGIEPMEITIGNNRYTVEGISASATGRNAGTYSADITGTPVIRDSAGNDVTDAFDISLRSGTLTVRRRSLVLTSSSAVKEYDGTPLVSADVTAGGDGFAPGEGAVYTVTGTQTVTGSGDNVFTYTFNENTEKDNYAVTVHTGRLTVTGRQAAFGITLRAKSSETVYDGSEQTVSGFDTLEFTVNGKNYTVAGVSASVSAVHAGTYDNVISGTPQVLDENGNDVTAEFAVSCISGQLKIAPRNVTLTSASDEKEYDGLPLQNDEVAAEGFAEGEGASFAVSGSITLPGSAPNSFTYTLNENTSAADYNIEVQPGTLRISSRTEAYPLHMQARSGEFMYDGTEKSVSGFETDTFTVNGAQYKVSGVAASVSGTDAGSYDTAIEGTPTVTDSSGADVTDQFAVEIEPGSLTVNRRTVILTSATAAKEYDGLPLRDETVTVSGDGFAAGQGADYRVEGTRTIPGTVSNTFTYALHENTKAENYDIRTDAGTLTVTDRAEPLQLTLQAAGGTFVYDGSEHSVSGLRRDTYTVNGRQFSVRDAEASVQGRGAGTYVNAITGKPRVIDENGNDVTLQFSLRTESGTMVIEKRKVILTSASASREYDGTALKDDSVTVGGDGFAEGEGAVYTVSGSQTIPGSSANAFTYTLNSNTEAGNYQITTVPGILQVDSRAEAVHLQVSANSGSFLYDGSEKTVSGFETTEFTVNGSRYRVTGLEASVSAVHAGTYDNIITGTPKVEDENGNDVTEQFMVDTENGRLTVSRRKAVLTSASASKEYDGTALKNDSVTVSGDGFAEGEGAVYTVSGSQTIAGSSPNSFSYTLNGNTDPADYEISTVFGTLSVTGRQNLYPVTVRSSSGTYLYDGTKKSVSGFETVQFRAGTQMYTVEGIQASVSAVHAGNYENIIEGTPVIRDSEGNDVTDQFSVRCENGVLSVGQRQLVLTSGSAMKEYDGTDLRNSEIIVSGDGWAENEGADYTFSGVQRIPGSSQNAFAYTFRNNTLASDYAVTANAGILQVAPRASLYEITVSANSGTFLYDGSEHAVDGIEEDTFEIEGNTYHIEGLQAAGKARDAGNYDVFVEGTPVVRDAQGNDVTEQFRVHIRSGRMIVEPRTVVLTSATAFRQYDGTALTDDGIAVSGDGWAEGEGAVYTVSGSQTVPGTADNAFSYVLNEGTKAGNYNIRTVFGTLSVSSRDEQYELTMRGIRETSMYDGSEKTVSGFETEEFTVNGSRYTVEGIVSEAKGTGAGTYAAKITGTPVVRDDQGNDVTSQFVIHYESGSLTVLPRTVLLVSGSARKEYDGIPLRNTSVTVGGDGWAENEGAVYTVSGTRTAAGTGTNTFTYQLYANTNAENYDIRTEYGSLEIIDRSAKYEITLRASGGSALYDGTVHTVSGFETTEFTVDGNTYTVEGVNAQGSGRSAGVYPVAITGTPAVRDSEGNDVTAQFAVHCENGSLRIAKRKLILTSASASAEYDGNPLRAPEVTAGGDGFAEGEGAVYTVSGERILPGSSENIFDYRFTGAASAADYDVTVVYGTLDVSKRSEAYAITLKSNGDEVLCDGSEHSVSGFETTEFTAGGHTYTVEGVSAAASAVHAGTYFNTITGIPAVKDENGNDVTEQFTVNTVTGILKVKARDVTLMSGSADKEYDGDPLTMDTVTVGGDGFAENEGASFTVTGTQTRTGSSDNTFTYTLNEGTDPSDYIFRVRNGVLSVHGRTSKYEIAIRSNGGTAVYDGTAHSVSGLCEDTAVINGHTYTIANVTASAEAVNAGTYTAAITGTPVILDEEGNDVTEEFVIHLEPGVLQILRRSVSLVSASAEKQYDGSPLAAPEVIIGGDGFAAEEGISYEVTGTQTAPGISANPFTYTFNEGTDPSNYDITESDGVLQVHSRDAKYIISLESIGGTFTYDGTVHTLNQLKSTRFGIGSETYTVSGMSAFASAVHAGSYPVLITGTPVVRDSNGIDVTSEFMIVTVPGTMTVEKRNVTLRSRDAAAFYNGMPVYDSEIVIGGDGFVRGDGVTCSVSGSRTLPGISENVFTYTLNEGTRAEDYNIASEFGSLTVYSRPDTARYEIAVKAANGSWVYDGSTHTAEGVSTVYGPADSEGVLHIKADGVDYTLRGLQASASAKDAGTYAVNVTGTPAVYDSQGNDVTAQFLIRTESGRMDIRRRSVILTSGSVRTVYNGREAVNETVEVSGDGWAENEGADYAFSGGRSLSGISPNAFTYTLKEGTDENNYDITTVFGEINVVPRTVKYEITVTARSGEYLYDGSTHTLSGLINSRFTVDGNTYTIRGLSASGSGRNAGVYPVTFSGIASVIDSEGNDVSDEFAVHITDGTLTVRPRTVILTSASAEAEYSGTPLQAAEITVSGDGWADGEGAVYHTGAVRILPGTSANTFTYRLNPDTDAANYIIQTAAGTLNVYSRNVRYRIEMQANSDQVLFDGEEHSVEGFEKEDFVIDELSYGVSGLNAFAAGIDPGIYTTEISGDAMVSDLTGADVTDQFAVIVENGRLTITDTYLLTVRFVDEDGNELAPPYTGRYAAGEAFGPVRAPEITGMLSDYDSVRSDEKGMPAHDLTIDIIYRPLTVQPAEPDEPAPGDQETVPEEPGEPVPGDQETVPAPEDAVPAVQPGTEVRPLDPSKETAAEVHVDEETGEVTLTEIEDTEIPLARASYWALVNLVTVVLDIIAAVILCIFAWLIGRKKETEEEEESEERTQIEEQEDQDEEEEDRKHRVILPLASVITAFVAVIIFLVTEDMRSPMVYTDRWTILMIILAIIEFVIAFVGMRNEKQEEEDQPQEQE